MTDQPSLLDWAARRRADGMRRAVEHADIVQVGWSEAAMICLLDYADIIGRPFMVEEVRAASGLPAPPDGRAWGAVVQRAARSGAISRVGYAPAKSSNLSPKCLWVLAKEGA